MEDQAKIPDAPLRTVVGNRIDFSLARHRSRRIIRELSEGMRERVGERLEIPEARGAFSTRKRALSKLKRDLGEMMLGAVADRTATKARIVILNCDLDEQGNPYRMGSKFINWGKRNPENFEIPQVPLVTMSNHVACRLIQRAGIATKEDYIDMLTRASGWAWVARNATDPGAWYMPHPKGLACFAMQSVPGGDYGGVIQHSVMTTFIGLSDMRAPTRRTYDWLAENCGFDVPRFPRISDVDPDTLAGWNLMRNEGRAWEMRREHAKRSQSAEILDCSP